MSGLLRYMPPPHSTAGTQQATPQEGPLRSLPRGAESPRVANAYVPPQPEGDRGPDPAQLHAAAMTELGRERTQVQAQSEAMATAIEAFAQSVAKLDTATQAAHEVLAHDAVTIGMLVAEQLIGHALTVDSKAVVDLVLAALKDVPDDAGVVVRVSNDDLPRIELVLAGSKRAAVDVVGDDSLAPGDCVVQSTGLIIDARLQHRLEGIGEALREEIPEGERLATHDEVSLEDLGGDRGHAPTAAPSAPADPGDDGGPEGISLGDLGEADEC